MPNNNQRVSFWIADSTYASIQQLAAQRKTTCSYIVRQLLDKALGVEAIKEDMDYIRSSVRLELESILEPAIERLAKISVKGGITSAAAYFLCAEALAAYVPPEQRMNFDAALSEAKKLAVGYMRMPHGGAADYLNDNDESMRRRT